MKRVLIGAAVLAFAAGASAQVCFNPDTKTCVPNIFGGCPEGTVSMEACPPETVTPTPAPTVVPTPVPTPPSSYFDTHGIKFSAKTLAKLLAFLAGLVTGIQFLKKVLENLSKWEWLVKMIPPLATVFAFFSSGLGPIILNFALTLATLLPAALTDGLLSITEIASLVGVVLGNDLLYRIIRNAGVVWPKK